MTTPTRLTPERLRRISALNDPNTDLLLSEIEALQSEHVARCVVQGCLYFHGDDHCDYCRRPRPAEFYFIGESPLARLTREALAEPRYSRAEIEAAFTNEVLHLAMLAWAQAYVSELPSHSDSPSTATRGRTHETQETSAVAAMRQVLLSALPQKD